MVLSREMRPLANHPGSIVHPCTKTKWASPSGYKLSLSKSLTTGMKEKNGNIPKAGSVSVKFSFHSFA